MKFNRFLNKKAYTVIGSHWGNIRILDRWSFEITIKAWDVDDPWDVREHNSHHICSAISVKSSDIFYEFGKKYRNNRKN